MITIEIFNILYSILYGVIALTGFIFATNPKKLSGNKFNGQIIFIFLFFLFILFGSRSFNVGTDTNNYINAFKGQRNISDIGFRLYVIFISFFSNNSRVFLYAMSFIFLLPLGIYFYKTKYKNKYLLFFIFASMLFFKNLGINIMRQGIAISFFLLSLNYHKKNKILYSIILFLISFSFQYSMIIPICVFLFSSKLKTIKLPLICLLFFSILSIFNFNILSFLKYVPIVNKLILINRINYVLNATWIEYRTGFRIDFFIFNIFFVILGLYFYKHSINKIPEYKSYLSSYLFTSSIFFLMFPFPYSDRFGLLSWIFIPFILLPLYQQIKSFKKYGLLFSYTIMLSFNIFFIILEKR